MSTKQPNTTDHRDIDAAPIPAGSDGEATVSAERAFLSDVRLVLALLNWARYPVLGRVFGVSRDQVNLLTFVLALSAAQATYNAMRWFIRLPWPLDGFDTAAAGLGVQEAGLAIAGPKARETHLFGTLIAVAAIGSLTVPGMRRAVHSVDVAAQRVGQQRMRIYGAAAEHERLKSAEQRRTPTPSRSVGRATVRRYGSFFNPVALRAPGGRP